MNESVTIDQPSTWRSKIIDYLSLERNVSIAAAAGFILGLGEELWKKLFRSIWKHWVPARRV
jgi:hypothetical protein